GRFHLRGLSGDDTRELETLLREHLAQTGSPLVASLIARLERGEDVFGRFTKLVPVDFQAVLALRERFEEDGTDPDGSEAWSSILEMTHGCPARIPHGDGEGASPVPARRRPAARLPRSAAGAAGQLRVRAAGRSLHGLRGPVLPPGVPAGQHHPG